MPYSIELPDGTLVQDIPDNLDPREAKRQILAKRPDLAPQTTIGGQVAQLPKALVRGAVGTLGTSAQGLAALALPESLEKPVIGALRRGTEALSPTIAPGYEESIPTKFAEALGSFGSFLIPGTAGAKLAGTAGRLGTTAAVAGGAGAGEALQRAEQAGATPEQISAATGFGTVVGLTEMLPVERALRFLKPAKETIDALAPTFKQQAIRLVKEAAISGGIEGAQEAASQVAQNLIAQQLYKPDQKLIEDVGENAAYGFGVGAVAETLLDTALGRKNRQALQAAQQEQKRKQEQAAAAQQAAQQAQQKQLEALGAGYGAGAGQAEGPVRLQRDYESTRQKVQDLQEQLAQAAAKGDLAKVAELDAFLKKQEETLTALQTQAKESGIEFKTKFDRADVEKQIQKLQSQLQKAGESGDVEKIRKLAPQLAEAQERLKAFSFEMGMEKQAAEKERAEIDARLAAEEELKDRENLLAQQVAATEQRPPLKLPEAPTLDISEVEAVFEQRFNEYLAKGMPREKAIEEATKRSETVRGRVLKKYQTRLDKYNADVEKLKEAALTPEERLARSQEGYEEATEAARKASFVDDIFDEIGNVIKPTGPINPIRISEDITKGRPITRVIQEFQDAQNTSYFDLMNLAQQLRNRDFIGGEGGIRGRELISMQDVRKNLEAAIEEKKKQYINAVLYRAAAERTALGRSGLDEDTALKLATQTKLLLDELVTRTSAPTSRIYKKEAFKRGEEEMGEDTRTKEERRFTYDEASLNRLQKVYGLDDTVLQYIRQFNKRLEELDAQRDQKLSPEVRRRVVAEFNRTFQQRAETLNEGLMRSVEKNIRRVVSTRGALTATEGELELTAPTEEGLSAKEQRLKGAPSPDRTRPVREAGDIEMEIDAKRRELEFVKSQTTVGPGLGMYGAPTTVFNKPTEIARLEREIKELEKRKTETIPGATPSLAGQLLRRREFTANKINDAIRLRGGEFDTATLNALEKVQIAAENGTATNELMDLADAAIARKGGATFAEQIEDQLKNIQQATQEGKQADLFGAPVTERTTPARLRALSESEKRKAAEKEARTPEAKLKALKQELADIEKELEGLAPKDKEAVTALLAQARAVESELTRPEGGFEKRVADLKASLKKVRADREKAKEEVKKLDKELDKLKEQREELIRKGANARSKPILELTKNIERIKSTLTATKAKVDRYVAPPETSVKPGAKQSAQNILDLNKEREALLTSGAKEGSAQVLSIDRAIAKAEEESKRQEKREQAKVAPRGEEILKKHWPLEFESQTEQIYAEAVDSYENIIQLVKDLAGVYRAAARREAGVPVAVAGAEQASALAAKKTEIKSAIRVLVGKIKKQNAKTKAQQDTAQRSELTNKRAADAALAGTARLVAEANTKAARLAEQARLESVGREGVRVSTEVVYGKTGQMFTVSTEETKLLRRKRDELAAERKALEAKGVKKNSKEYNSLYSQISDLSIQIAAKETPLLRRVTEIIKKDQPVSAEQKAFEKLLDTQNLEETLEYLEDIVAQTSKQRGTKQAFASKEEANRLKVKLTKVVEELKTVPKFTKDGKKFNSRYVQLESERTNLENLIEARTTPFVENLKKKVADLRMYLIVGPQTYERLVTQGGKRYTAEELVKVLYALDSSAAALKKSTERGSKAKLKAVAKQREFLKEQYGEALKEAVGAAATLRRQERVTAVKPRAPTPQANFVVKAAREHSLSTAEATEVVLTAQSRTGVQSALRKHGVDSAQYKKAMDTAVAAEVKARAKQATKSFEDTDSVFDIRSGISWRIGKRSKEGEFSKDRAEAAFKNLKTPAGVKVVFAHTFDELPDYVKKQIPDSSLSYADRAKGGVLLDGTVILIGKNHISEADLETTAVHEIVGHYGVDTLLGDSGMKTLTKNIEAQPGGIMGLAEALGPEAVDGVRQATITSEIDSGFAEFNFFLEDWGSEDPALRDYIQAVGRKYFYKGVEAGRAEAKEWEKDGHENYDGISASIEKELARIKKKYGKGLTKEQVAIEQVRELIAYTAHQRTTEGFLKKANRFIKELVGTLRAALKKMGFTSFGLDRVSTSDIYKIIRDAEQTLGKNRPSVYVSPTGQAAYRLGGVRWADTAEAREMEEIAKGGMIGKEKGLLADLKANLFGLTGATQWIDRLAPVERAAAYMKDEAKAMQMMYHLRMHDYGLNATSQVASEGPLTYIKDDKGFHVLTSKSGASLSQIASELNKAKEVLGDENAVTEAFSLYMAAVRSKQLKNNLLDYEEKNITKQQLERAYEIGDKIPAFRKARELYKQYNEGLLDFLVETGAMSQKKRDELIKDREYTPFYRMRGGIAELVVGEEIAPITVGDIKNQPHLHQLVGGNKPILDFFTGALQNTRLLTEMALRNQATKETAFAFANSGLLGVPLDENGNVKLRKDGKPFNGIFKGEGKASPNVIHFKHNGENYYAEMNEKQLEAIGIPADLLVKGMEGIRATIPSMLRLMSVPTKWLRNAITRNPLYVARQIVRDSTNNWIVTGSDAKPLIGAAAEFAKIVAGKSEGEKLLQQRAILGGQTITGTPEDMQKILLGLTKGEGYSISALCAKADRMAIAADAASRVRIYNSFRKQGLSDMEATLATMESMNYTKRGLSPSLYMANMLMPFLYAQIQGLNVTYKAMRGKMPYAQKLNQRSKFWTRGMMLMGTTLAYAAMMDDDEAYKNANPKDKLANWFVYIPGLDEPIRVPIPFETGLIFKAIPEAIVMSLKNDEEAAKAWKGISGLLAQSVPGDIPTFIKPGIELTANYSFFTDDAIISRREQQFMPAEQYRENTSEFAKFLGGMANVSPIGIEYLIRGHFGSLGVAGMQALNILAVDPSPVPKPEGRASTLPIVGALFQPKDANGAIEAFYDVAERMEKAEATFNKMVNEGRAADAKAFAQEYSRDIALSDAAQSVKKEMGELAAMRRLVLESPLSSAEKRARIDDIRKAQIALTKAANQILYAKP